MKNIKGNITIGLSIFITVSLFVNCSSMGGTIRNIQTVPDPFSSSELFQLSFRTLQRNHPDMYIERPDQNLFSIHDIKQEAFNVILDKHSWDGIIPLDLFLVYPTKYPDYCVAIIVYSRRYAGSRYRYEYEGFVYKLIQRE